MAIFFTSDLHLGHANIVRLCNRPFADVGEMDSALIQNWNTTVGHDDDVWVLGDFAFRNARSVDDYLRRLKGRKHLVHGNHDSVKARISQEWSSSQPMAETIVDGVPLTLLHYAMRTWPRSGHGSIHLYGHSHGNLPGDRQSCDVGVDCWDFRPVSLQEIRLRLATLPERGSSRRRHFHLTCMTAHNNL